MNEIIGAFASIVFSIVLAADLYVTQATPMFESALVKKSKWLFRLGIAGFLVLPFSLLVGWLELNFKDKIFALIIIALSFGLVIIICQLYKMLLDANLRTKTAQRQIPTPESLFEDSSSTPKSSHETYD